MASVFDPKSTLPVVSGGRRRPELEQWRVIGAMIYFQHSSGESGLSLHSPDEFRETHLNPHSPDEFVLKSSDLREIPF
jgi:hypothetical protein